MKNAYFALEQVAKKHGIPVEGVIAEIEKALTHPAIRAAAIKEMSAPEAVTYFRDLVIESEYAN